MKLTRALFLLLALLVGLASGTSASIADGTELAFRAGFPGRMGPVANTASLNSETSALIAAMTTAPTAERVAQIDSLITSLKNSGVWAKKRTIYVLAAADSQAASLNWKNPGANTITILTGTPVFNADRGYTFNNLNGLDTNFNPTTAGIVLNSESLSVWVRNNLATNTYAAGTNGSAIQPRRSTGDNASANSQTSTLTTGTAGAMTTSVGLSAISRSASGNFIFYKNGSAYETLTRASVGVDNHNLIIGGRNNASGALNGGSAYEVSIVTMGDSMTADEMAAEYSAFSTYMTAVGAQ